MSSLNSAYSNYYATYVYIYITSQYIPFLSDGKSNCVFLELGIVDCTIGLNKFMLKLIKFVSMFQVYTVFSLMI